MAQPMYGDTAVAAGQQASYGIGQALAHVASAPGGSAWHANQREMREQHLANARYSGGASGLGGSYGYNTGLHPNRQVGR